MNYRGRTFPRSRSFDPSCLQSRKGLDDFRHTQQFDSHQSPGMSAEGDLSNLTSGLGLQQTPSYTQYRNVRMTSPLSPLSDRSIEAMSVSDVSGHDVELMDINDEGDASVIDPFGSVSLHENNLVDQNKKKPSAWLWSSIIKDSAEKKLADVDARSVMSEESAKSVASCVTCGSDQTTLTQRSTSTVASSNLPASLYESEYTADRDSSKHSVRSLHQPIEHAANAKRSRCKTCCLSVLNLFAIFAALVGLMIFSSRDFRRRSCAKLSDFNMTRLMIDLEENVYGQHIATQTVTESLSELLASPDKNVTVLSFHGWTGIGKNFVSGFIANRLPEEAVHRIIVPLDFAHGHSQESHNKKMFHRIVENIPDCGMVLFIIDEVDKATTQAIDGLYEALKNISTSHDLLQAKVLVLLLSNSGGSAINRYFLDQILADRHRESIERSEVVDFMRKIDSAQLSKEWYVPLVEDGLIDTIVPFLPLEKMHTVLCIKRYIAETRPRIGPTDMEQIVEHVIEQMAFFPNGMELFSSTGCRGVALKVDMTID